MQPHVKGNHLLLGWDEAARKLIAVSKVSVCAILSGHPRCSKDRSKRVFTMDAGGAADKADEADE
jgi:hypothetical protein